MLLIFIPPCQKFFFLSFQAGVPYLVFSIWIDGNAAEKVAKNISHLIAYFISVIV